MSEQDLRTGFVEDDGVEDDPAVAGTVTFNPATGTTLHVSYASRMPQFARPERWFEDMGAQIPSTLIFDDGGGSITLIDPGVVRMRGHGIVSVQVRADVTVFGLPRSWQSAYAVERFASVLDGLGPLCGFAPVTIGEAGGTRRIVVSLEPQERIEWEAQGYTYSLVSRASWTGRDGEHFEIVDSRPYLETRRTDGSIVSDHFSAHWPIRALLTLLYGAPVRWREHWLQDDEFPTWTAGGTAVTGTSSRVELRSTVRDHDEPESDDLHRVNLSVGIEPLIDGGFVRWIDRYADDEFRRAVDPAVEVFNGATRFVEPQLMMLAMALDRFGHYRFERKARRPQHVNILKCLDEAGLDLPAIGSRLGIASAIARMNNDLKHPDRETDPTSPEIRAVTRLAKFVVRAQLLDLVDVDPDGRIGFFTGFQAREVIRRFTSHGMTVADDGTILHAG
ncbi:hypothetical protein GCM10009846_03900 [Agrococcus versicolor]|uniref:ApeA N-terminal domain-containing protein n=1 Tax=Agrococcus versicolor TaxID=501482 RepID=A0ABN3AKV2_9MICO